MIIFNGLHCETGNRRTHIYYNFIFKYFQWHLLVHLNISVWCELLQGDPWNKKRNILLKLIVLVAVKKFKIITKKFTIFSVKTGYTEFTTISSGLFMCEFMICVLKWPNKSTANNEGNTISALNYLLNRFPGTGWEDGVGHLSSLAQASSCLL